MPDFNGDGRDDLLWWNSNGTISNWLGREDGGWLINDAAALRLGDPYWFWEILGTGDFNGDGLDDILWMSDANDISNWLGTIGGGFLVNDSNALRQIPANTGNFAGIGDFNGDGRDDILWWDSSTKLTVWTGRPSGGFDQNLAMQVADHPLLGWWVAGVGDFNGDGRDDILWRNAGLGGISNWLAVPGGGFAVNDANAYASVPNDWSAAGIADFNGDGNDDILWRNWQTGALSNWLATDAGGWVVNDANALAVVPPDWAVAGVGDYDGDGRGDILWRNQNGALSNWLGTQNGGWLVNDANAWALVETDWQIGANYNPWDDGEWGAYDY